MILYILVIAAIVVCGAALIRPQARMVCGPAAAVLVTAAVAVRAATDVDADVDSGVLGIFAATLAVLGGSVVATSVFDSIDARTDDEADSMKAAGEILRGGTWIGALERFAVFGSLVAGYPAGVAYVLAVKGLGRYPELRSGDRPGAAERFIIGTLVSVIWAALCAYAATGFVPREFFGRFPD